MKAQIAQPVKYVFYHTLEREILMILINTNERINELIRFSDKR